MIHALKHSPHAAYGLHGIYLLIILFPISPQGEDFRALPILMGIAADNLTGAKRVPVRLTDRRGTMETRAYKGSSAARRSPAM